MSDPLLGHLPWSDQLQQTAQQPDWVKWIYVLKTIHPRMEGNHTILHSYMLEWRKHVFDRY